MAEVFITRRGGGGGDVAVKSAFYTASGTFTVPKGVNAVYITACAGGGGGGKGGLSGSTTQGSPGGITSFGSLLSLSGGTGGASVGGVGGGVLAGTGGSIIISSNRSHGGVGLFGGSERGARGPFGAGGGGIAYGGYSSGGGGGAGDFVIDHYLEVTPNQTYEITIGNGGSSNAGPGGGGAMIIKWIIGAKKVLKTKLVVANESFTVPQGVEEIFVTACAGGGGGTHRAGGSSVTHGGPGGITSFGSLLSLSGGTEITSGGPGAGDGSMGFSGGIGGQGGSGLFAGGGIKAPGGPGGGAGGSGVTSYGGEAGGGAGEFVVDHALSVVPGQSYSITIGAGGTGSMPGGRGMMLLKWWE